MIWGGWLVPSSNVDSVRLVIDETSFGFDQLDVGQLDTFLSQFNDTLQDLRHSRLEVWKPPLFAYTPSAEGQDLYSYLMVVADRDIMRRFFSLIDKCPEWEASYPRCEEVEVGERSSRSAWSISFAVTAMLANRGVACLVFARSSSRGFVEVRASIGSCRIFFFADALMLKHFWRGLYDLEDIPESSFFGLADRAYPELLFHPDLTFRRFRHAYNEIRGQVVRHLGALNDYFLDAYRSALAAGRPSDVEAYFGSLGIGGVSAESVKTHRNSSAMRLRDVEFDGRQVRCEWHTKLRPEVDRIHFAFGEQFGEKVFIGIFVDHLPT